MNISSDREFWPRRKRLAHLFRSCPNSLGCTSAAAAGRHIEWLCGSSRRLLGTATASCCSTRRGRVGRSVERRAAQSSPSLRLFAHHTHSRWFWGRCTSAARSTTRGADPGVPDEKEREVRTALLVAPAARRSSATGLRGRDCAACAERSVRPCCGHGQRRTGTGSTSRLCVNQVE